MRSGLARHILRYLAALLPLLPVAAFAVDSPPTGTVLLRYAPADLDYGSVCLDKHKHSIVLDRDWTAWDGSHTATPPGDLFDIATEYLLGSERVKQSVPTSLKILDYLATNHLFDPARVEHLVGKAMLAEATDTAGDKAAEAKLLHALGGGAARAAFDLAEAYGVNGPTPLRDPVKARTYYQIGAASGDVDAELAYARLVDADGTAPDADKQLAVRNALLGMMQQVAAGDCRYMETIGFLFLNGDLVVQNFDVAALWFEQDAKTGDAHIQERVGRLLASRLVTEVDYSKALDFLEQAADQQRPFAALTVGKAYATGVGRPEDPVRAEKYLLVAAAGGVAESNSWLARLYQGEFGGTARPQLAQQRFELMLSSGPADPDIEAQYGQFLNEATGAVADPKRGLALLEDAAQRGSGLAAILAGDIYLGQSHADPSLYTRATQYYELGVKLGKPEGARSLSKMYACGLGVSLSMDQAKAWNDRAFALGSSAALYDAGRADLAGSEPAIAETGRTLITQSALLGYAPAIGYVIAHAELGGDGFPQDPAAVQRLQHFLDVNPDPQLKLNATLAAIRERVALLHDGDAIAAQYKLLDDLVASGAAAAATLKAQLLIDAGKGDPAQLLELYRIGATGGDVPAMRQYATALLADPKSDLAVARGWLDRSAKGGDIKARILEIDATAPDALQQLQATARQVDVCTVDERVGMARAFAAVTGGGAAGEAATWLRSATLVVGSDPGDQFKIGDAYRNGVAGSEHVADAEAFFQKSADLGRTSALYDLADGDLRGLWKDASPSRAKELLLKLYHAGDMAAGSRLAGAIADKLVTATLTDISALLPALSAADSGGKTGMKLVKLDGAGTFGDVHPDLQLALLQGAAADGNVAAMVRLYRAYASGIGVPVAPQTAVSWLTKAATAGDAEASRELAAAYDVGFGVPTDPAQAARWRQLAAPSMAED